MTSFSRSGFFFPLDHGDFDTKSDPGFHPGGTGPIPIVGDPVGFRRKSPKKTTAVPKQRRAGPRLNLALPKTKALSDTPRATEEEWTQRDESRRCFCRRPLFGSHA